MGRESAATFVSFSQQVITYRIAFLTITAWLHYTLRANDASLIAPRLALG
jgi:hypothetical protein